MVELAIAAEPSFQLSLLDAPSSGQTTFNYTYDTLATLRQSHPPGTQFFLLLGADSLRTFHHWHRAAEIPFLAQLIVASRPGETLSELATLLPPSLIIEPIPGRRNSYSIANPAGAHSELILLTSLDHEVSATQLRTQLQTNPNDPLDQIPKAVLNYIQQHRLYAQPL